jgi:hypothetical protein
MIGSNETKAPPAVQAFLSCIRSRRVDLLSNHVTDDAKMSAVGFINGCLAAKNAKIADVLKEVLPVDQSGGMSDVTMKTPNSWQVECIITRAKGEPIIISAICNLEASGKISSVSAEIEPGASATFFG